MNLLEAHHAEPYQDYAGRIEIRDWNHHGASAPGSSRDDHDPTQLHKYNLYRKVRRNS